MKKYLGKFDVNKRVLDARKDRKEVDWEGVPLIFDDKVGTQEPAYAILTWYQTWNAILCYVFDIVDQKERTQL